MTVYTAGSLQYNWRWLPNILSLSRGVLAFPLYFMALDGRWVAGFWLLIVALLTDFFDGLAAKKLHAESTLGGHLDRISDYLLCVGGSLGLIIGAHWLTLQLLWAAIPLSGFVGYVKFFLPEENKLRRVVSIFSITLLFITWSFIAWGYLYQAFGWSWLYPLVTLVVIAVAARLKRHRLKAWFGWLAADRTKA